MGDQLQEVDNYSDYTSMINASHFNNDTTLHFPTQTKDFIIALNVAIGLTCILSMLGAGAIILSFIFSKELHTTSRFLLLNLSIADLIVAVSNIIGTTATYKFEGINQTQASHSISSLCQFQAFTGLYGTDASILWTVVLLTYLYISLVCYRPNRLMNRIISVMCMVVCWGVPLVIAVWFLVEKFYGYEPGFSPGFCTIVTENRSQIYRIIVGYEIFLFISFLVLPVLCVMFACHVKWKRKKEKNSYYNLNQQYVTVKNAETKLIFVPIVFIFIRIWSLVTDIVTFYIPIEASLHFRQLNISAFIVFMAGIGDSAQGFMNGIFFCLLTPAVRYKILLGFVKCCHCLCCFRCCKKEGSEIGSSLRRESSSISISYSKSTIDNESVTTARSRSLTDVSADAFYESTENKDELMHA